MGIALFDMEIVKKFDTEKLSSIAESINFAPQAGFKDIRVIKVIKVFKVFNDFKVFKDFRVFKAIKVAES